MTADRLGHSRVYPVAGLGLFLMVALGAAESGEPPPPPRPLTATVLRGLAPVDGGIFDLTVFEAAELSRTPSWTADDFLRQVPGFSLFRRTSSLVANPSTQGASLRGIGPSAASRSLVLFDGVPLNDAFGGWVYWSLINLRFAERVEVVRGGGSAAWGNTALGGVIQIIPRRPEPKTREAHLVAGSQNTWQAAVYGSERAGPLGVAIEARAFATDGYKRVRADQRGAVDIRSDARHEVVNLLADYEISSALRLTVRTTAFNEARGNGTPLTNNDTEIFRAHAKIEGTPGGDFSWRLDSYGVRSDYANTFSAVSPDRNSEVLVNDQFSVPSTTLGSGWRGTWAGTGLGAVTLGGDFIGIQGRTEERVIFAGGDRRTGGRQILGGIFAEQDWQPADLWHWQAGLRLDYWRNHRGFNRPPNSPPEDFPARERFIPSGRVGVSRELSSSLVFRTAVYQAFRVPTINELYRPFQVGADRTLANEMLDPEQLLGSDIGLDYVPNPTVELRNTLFFNAVKNPILNVTIGRTATGGQLREKRNIEETRIQGWESELRVNPADGWTAYLRYALTDARVERADDQPSLVGRRLAQVPRQVLTAGSTYRWMEAGPEFTLQGRWTDAQFEDDLNRRRLGSYPLVDASIQQRLGDRGSIFVAMENVLDRHYADGITGNGIVTEGRPRSYQIGLIWEF